MIALTCGIALLIGWYRGFTARALELAAVAFVLVLALQTVGLVVASREPADQYWLTVTLIGAGWVACVGVGSAAHALLRR